MTRVAATMLAIVFATGCSCDETEELRVGGDHPYLRCAIAEPPEGERRVGGTTLRFDERRLTIDGDVERIAAFAGPGDRDPTAVLRAVRAFDPDLVLVLGDLGRERIEANVRALRALDRPVIFVAGGGDELPAIERALRESPIVHGSGLRAIEVGGLALVPVAGAPDGRYARSENACGLSGADVEAIVEEASDDHPRYLLAWAGPRGDGATSLTRGVADVEAGSAVIARLEERTHARGVIFAWPSERAGAAIGDHDRLRVALPSIASARWRADGSRAAAGFVRMTVSDGVLAVMPDAP